MATVDDALAWAAAGRAVFPGYVHRDGSKRPYTRATDAQPAPWGASTDEAVVRRYWVQWPDAHIGLPTGNGLVVIDGDPRHGAPDDPPADWPATRTARTPSGGWHTYWKTDADIRNSVGKLGAGLDVRGRGGMVFAPPSAGYAWTSDAAVQPLPIALAAAALDGGRRGVSAGVFGRFEYLDEVPVGQRNDYLTRLAGFLWSCDPGYTVAEVLAAARAEADQLSFAPREGEVESIVASVSGYHGFDRHEVRAELR